MELLNPEHTTRDPLHGFFTTAGFDGTVRFISSENVEGGSGSGSGSISITGGERVFVAVGKSVDKALSLLQWSFKQFNGREICLLHVHQPSPLIPTLLGKLPASQANNEVVSAYRQEEKEKTKRLLGNYLSACARTKVRASIIVIESDQVHRGILELVNRHCIKKLVIGAVPENCMKMWRSSSKATYASKNVPACCEIWFVNKGRIVGVREAVENPYSAPSITQEGTLDPRNSRSRSFRCGKRNLSLQGDNLSSRSSRTMVCDSIDDQAGSEQANLGSSMYEKSLSGLSGSGSDSAVRRMLSFDSDSRGVEDCLYNQANLTRIEAEVSKSEAFSELLKCRKLETEVLEAINKVKVFESVHAREVKLREKAENELGAAMHEQEELLEEKEELTRRLHKTMRNIALLDSHVQMSNRRCEEASEELKLIETSMVALRLEKQRIRSQKLEAERWLERWRCRRQSRAINCNEFIGFANEDLLALAEFSLAELRTATCDFSESFKIGQGGNGCVYKGEMMGRSVAIKKLHPHSMQGQLGFQQEVQVLSKLQHPHLVQLFGYCPEAWSLIYEYLPNGSLQDRLFRKANVFPLPWKTRTRIISEICSALCFLHSSKPEKIVHGDLKPENILLDSELSCKICDFGFCKPVIEEAFDRPNFHRNTEPKSGFPYTDPEFHRFGILTPKSDVYSFGIIILQLLTGKPPFGLAGELRKAVSLGKLASVLDSSGGEWPIFAARRLVDIGLQCCETNGRDRPNLTPSLVRELEQLHASEERSVPSFFLCPILQEIMHDPQIAADGFTYEGEAIRAWFTNGRETSPMTNLKLRHLHLTPNHGLRLAIQDWLCKS